MSASNSVAEHQLLNLSKEYQKLKTLLERQEVKINIDGGVGKTPVVSYQFGDRIHTVTVSLDTANKYTTAEVCRMVAEEIITNVYLAIVFEQISPKLAPQLENIKKIKREIK
jgi:hypothetical protein